MQDMLDSIRAGFSLVRDNKTSGTTERKTDAQSTLPSNAGNQASGSNDAKAPSAESINHEQTGYQFSKARTAEELAGKVSDLVGRKRLNPDDPYAVENRRLKEQDRTLWDKAKQVFMRNFAPGGLLPRSIFEAKITRDGEIESWRDDY
ncbi:MAG: hypothetical protein U5L02_13210 [Rheinheimera sp.]|nr:hypothetical protein [Rheinheimera sp.]